MFELVSQFDLKSVDGYVNKFGCAIDINHRFM